MKSIQGYKLVPIEFEDQLSNLFKSKNIKYMEEKIIYA